MPPAEAPIGINAGGLDRHTLHTGAYGFLRESIGIE